MQWNKFHQSQRKIRYAWNIKDFGVLLKNGFVIFGQGLTTRLTQIRHSCPLYMMKALY